MDVAFASWLDQCPDKVRFVLQYNDLRSDIARVIETFGYDQSPKQFIEEVFEIAFGDNAINRDYSMGEVLDRLMEFSDDALRYNGELD